MSLKRYLVLCGLPALIACQNPVRQGTTASNPVSPQQQPSLATSTQPSARPKPQGFWIQTSIIEDYREDKRIQRCGDRDRLPQVVSIDGNGEVTALLFAIENDDLVFKKVSLLGTIKPDMRLEHNQTFPTVRLEGDKIEFVSADGQVEPQAHFSRTTTEEAKQALVMNALCLNQVMTEAHQNTPPATPVDFENRVVFVKNAIQAALREPGGTSLLGTGAKGTVAIVLGTIADEAYKESVRLKNANKSEKLRLYEVYHKQVNASIQDLKTNGTTSFDKAQLKSEIRADIVKMRKNLGRMRINMINYAVLAGGALYYTAEGIIKIKNRYQLETDSRTQKLLSLSDEELRKLVRENPEEGNYLLEDIWPTLLSSQDE